VLVVEGPAGAGKTRLLSALREAVGQDAQLLAARGTELERAVPFGIGA
jgi:ribose 1,5-bisphosphokinase PhnN